MNWVLAGCLALIAARWAAQAWLDRLNRRAVAANAGALPPTFRGMMDEGTYTKSVEYTLAKSRSHGVESAWDSVVLAFVLCCGVLPWSFGLVMARLGASAWATAGWLMAWGFVMALADLPLAWRAQFRLEERFGFNTTTQRLWWIDRVKGFLLGVILGYPLLVLVLKLVEWTGAWWWLWAWGCVLAFQLIMTVAAPVFILPLFNKLTPLAPGSLRERLLALGTHTGFHARNILVMDGSKRSRHSNAFFTGFGRFRKIVLFDTIVQQLEEAELEAVLAHEIGHYKRRHIPKLFAASAAGLLAGFLAVDWLARQAWFCQSLGFAPGNSAAVLLLLGLAGGLLSFWLSPIANWWSRRCEYEADAFAAEATQGPGALIGALRKLNEKNLSNLTPHPVYSGFYYSHPTLLERERALTPGSA